LSLGNDSILYQLGLQAFPVTDGVVLLTTGQAAAVPCIGDLIRVVKSVSNGSLILKSRLTGEAPGLVFVLNDSASTIVVFCWQGENMSGSLNGSLSIPSGQGGIFVGSFAVAKGGVATANPTDWRVAVIP
jgi:hypothetical protein